MLLTVLAYGMIIVFMYVIMKKKMSPFTALVIIPLIFAMIAVIAGVANEGTIGDFVLDALAAKNEVAYVRFASVFHKFETLDDFVKILEQRKKGTQ